MAFQLMRTYTESIGWAHSGNWLSAHIAEIFNQQTGQVQRVFYGSAESSGFTTICFNATQTARTCEQGRHEFVYLERIVWKPGMYASIYTTDVFVCGLCHHVHTQPAPERLRSLF